MKIVLELSNYVSKKELEDTTSTNLASKRGFIALKIEDGKLDINKLLNVLSSMKNLKTNVNDSDNDKFLWI